MRLEILMSTMNQEHFELINQANINSDTVLINQTDINSYSEIKKNNHLIRKYSYNERGVGKSRNHALLASDADICLIADDDIKYNEDYEEIILAEFENNKDADVIIFDVFILEEKGYRPYRNKNKKINKFNFMKHGGPKIAFRRDNIVKNNIFFSLLFGGGAKYGSGEDSIFLKECLNSGLKVYEVDKNIGEIDNRKSTWFNGYTDKYYYDKGALFKVLFPLIWPLMCLQYILRHHRKKGGLVGKIKQMFKGAREY